MLLFFRAPTVKENIGRHVPWLTFGPVRPFKYTYSTRHCGGNIKAAKYSRSDKSNSYLLKVETATSNSKCLARV